MNLKRWWLWLFCFLCCECVVAQTISVTATITDSDSQTWNYGSGFVQLVSPNGPPFYNGTAVSTAPQVLTFNSSGALAVTLYNTSTITPTGAQYRWTLCSWTSAPCTTFLTSVTTANLSTLLSGLVAVPRFNSAPAAYGYADVEVIAPPYPGGGYFNVNNSVSRQCVLTPPSTTCTWQNGGGGSSGFPITLGSTSIAASSTTTTIAGLTLTSPTFTTPALGTPASGNASNLTNFPTLNQSTTGNAATATALASTPTLCSTGQAPTGVLASGNATGCASYAAPPVLLSCTTSCTVTATYTIVVCTNTCTITPLAPSAVNQLCVRNDVGVTSVITLAALGAGNYYETYNHTGYGTANHTVTSSGAATDAICYVGRDANHYLVWGTPVNVWTD